MVTSSFGIINPSTGVLSSVATFPGRFFSNEGAYNTTINCYYAWGYSNGGSSNKVAFMNQISPTGTVTQLAITDSVYTYSLTYNATANKFYCVTNGHIAEITTTATTCAITNTIATTYAPHRYTNITADNATGDVYFITGDTVTYHIEKYHPGSASSTVIASGTGAWTVLGLRFNKNDNNLYGIRENYTATGYDFIKIDPATGTITTLSTLNFDVIEDGSSMCIDACADHYIVSTFVGLNTPILVQLSMTGAIIHVDTTANIYQGIYAN